MQVSVSARPPSGDRRRGRRPFSVRTIPSSDRAFDALVRRVVETIEPSSPGELEARLRPLVPRIVVRERALANEPEPAWYVYREGRWVADAEPEWWDDPAAGRLRYSPDLRITEANDAAARLLGLLKGSELVGRHYSEFVPPGAAEDAAMLTVLLFEFGELGGTVAAYRADGRVIRVEHRTELRADGVETVLRSEPGSPVRATDPATPAAAAIRLEVEPHDDETFAGYARTTLDRMADPTPDSLQQLLRALYPGAIVRGSAGAAAWTAARNDHEVDPGATGGVQQAGGRSCS